MAVEEVYLHPDDYDLEVAERDVHDLSYWISLLTAVRPKSVLEVGCGTGRLTLPLAREGARAGFSVTGIDAERSMLERASTLRAAEPPGVQKALTLTVGDVRHVRLGTRFDAVLMPYGVAHHLVNIKDQLEAFRNVRRHLRLGGVFALDVCAPDMLGLCRAMKGTARLQDLAAQTLDGKQLRRTVASSYSPATQLATHEYEYEASEPDGRKRRYTSTFDMHVYFPRELMLLCLATGLKCERLVGSYDGAPFDDAATQLILLARRA